MRFRPRDCQGSYDAANTSPQIVHLPSKSLKPSIAWFFFILSLQVAVIVVLIVVTFVDIIIQHYNDKLTTRGQLLYTLVVTIVATLLGTATEGELRKLWVYVIVEPGNSDGEEVQRTKKMQETSVVLGLGKIGDMVRKTHVLVVFGLAGLITTAIVTGLQPTSILVARDLPIPLYPTRNLTDQFAIGRDCYRKSSFDDTDSIPSRWFTWPLPSDPAINLTISSTRRTDQGRDRCPTDYILPTFQTLTDRVSTISYTLPGSSISVDRAASGVPYNLIHYWGVNYLKPDTYEIKTSPFGTWSMASFGWASMCVPLITKGIASCKPGDDVKRMMDRLEVRSGNCTLGRAIHPDSESENGEIVAGACTEGRSPGRATVLIGATGDHASQLREAVLGGSIKWPEVNSTSTELSVDCEIDLTDSLSFRRVMIAPFDRDSQVHEDEHHTWRVSGARTSSSGTRPEPHDEFGDECVALGLDNIPLSSSQFLTPETLAAGAASSWQLLSENLYRDGHLTALLNGATEYDFRHLDFWRQRGKEGVQVPQSLMEELLTQAASMAVGFHLGTFNEQRPEDSNLRREVQGGKVAHYSVRVGIKDVRGLLFLLPELIVVGVLGWLWWRVKKIQKMSELKSGRETL